MHQTPLYLKWYCIMDDWVDEHMVTSGRSRYGKTAKAGYKKSLYMFFIFIINQEAKNV